jgi:hypothetical protein
MNKAVQARGIALGAAALLAGSLLLSACGGAGSSGSSSPGSRQKGLEAVPAPADHAAEGAPAFAENGPASATSTISRVVPFAQSLIETAQLSLRAPNVRAAAARATSIVVKVGGYTAGEQIISGTSRHGRAQGQVSLTLKIPEASYLATLAQLSGLGKEISRSQQTQDVTQEVADVSSRVTSAEDAISSLRKLLGKAGSVGGLLSVQDQINNEESTLEALLAQQRSLSHQTSYATVSMLVLPPVVHAKPHKRATAPGFAKGLGGGWHALKVATSWLLTALGAALPFIVLAVLLAGIGYLARRRVTRRRASQSTG